jgi:hypothetical protein
LNDITTTNTPITTVRKSLRMSVHSHVSFIPPSAAGIGVSTDRPQGPAECKMVPETGELPKIKHLSYLY